MSLSNNTFVAIGDIHGCASSLEALIARMDEAWGTHPVYVFLGDYADRGPDSKRVVDLLLEFDQDHDCVFIRGNHDQMLLDAVHDDEWSLWLSNGGETTLNSYDAVPEDFTLPQEHYDFFVNTKLWWDTEEYFFVHGGINPDKSIQENLDTEHEVRQFIWQRAHIKAREVQWEKTVVFGHTPVKDPIVEPKKLGLDTGCVYNRQGLGVLSAASLPELEFITHNCTDC